MPVAENKIESTSTGVAHEDARNNRGNAVLRFAVAATGSDCAKRRQHTPQDSSTVLQNRNSTAAEASRTEGAGNQSSNAMRNKESVAHDNAGAKLASLSEHDRKFVMEASTSNATEIEAGQLALSTSNNSKVKKFAEQMVKDHQQLADELNAALQKSGIDVPRAEPKDEVLSVLKSLRGNDFDQAYVEHVAVDEHRKAVELFSDESAKGDNAALKGVASKGLAKIKHHYEMGKRLSKSLAKASTK